MQVFGGMGYVEETGVAQFYRDVRVTAIYEGTNGIQAMDMVGRKLADGGAAAQALIEAVEETARAPRASSGRGWRRRRSGWRGDRLDGGGRSRTTATPAPPYLRAFALTLGGHYLREGGAGRGREAARGAGGLPCPPAAAAGAGALRGRLRRRGAALCLRPRVLNEPPGAVRFPSSRPAPGAAVEIAEGVLWIRLPLPFRPDHLNAYALDDGDGWTIVDTGLDTAAARGLGGAHRRAARRPAGVRVI